jgi:hypothetical protein
MFAVVLMLPVPEVVLHCVGAGLLGAHVQVTPVSAAGTLSATAALMAADGPPLATVTV